VYAALKNDKKAIMIILTLDQDTTLIINLTSPSKFKVGGAAIFPALNKNHQRPILGIKLSKPFLISNLRLLIRSYTIFAKQNKPEEHKPCPTITINAPLRPHQPNTTKPQSTKPIWATDE
jgi:hypothetical protein